jgi:H+/Cl- antiporter ClcA
MLLRLLGLLMFLAGVAIVVVMFEPGPTEVADWMGESCSRNGTHNQQCSIWDVLGFLWVAPVLILIGGVMALALRPEDKGQATLDLSRFRRG